MTMETSKTESLGATNSIELVIPGVWSIDGMMTGRRKTLPVLSEIHRDCPHLMFSYLSYIRRTSLLLTHLMEWGDTQAYSCCDVRVHLCL
jgi:hypothetical protein